MDKIAAEYETVLILCRRLDEKLILFDFVLSSRSHSKPRTKGFKRL